VLAAILCACSGAAVAGTLVAVAFTVAFVVFRAAPRDEGGEVLFVAVLFVAVLLAVLLVAVARAGAAFLAAAVAFAADDLTDVVLTDVTLAVALAVAFVGGAALSADPPFFADIAFFTAIFGPFKVAVGRPGKCGQVA